MGTDNTVDIKVNVEMQEQSLSQLKAEFGQIETEVNAFNKQLTKTSRTGLGGRSLSSFISDEQKSKLLEYSDQIEDCAAKIRELQASMKDVPSQPYVSTANAIKNMKQQLQAYNREVQLAKKYRDDLYAKRKAGDSSVSVEDTKKAAAEYKEIKTFVEGMREDYKKLKDTKSEYTSTLTDEAQTAISTNQQIIEAMSKRLAKMKELRALQEQTSQKEVASLVGSKTAHSVVGQDESERTKNIQEQGKAYDVLKRSADNAGKSVQKVGNENVKAAAHTYYIVRSMKMLKFQLDRMDESVNKMVSSFKKALGIMGKIITSVIPGFGLLSSHIRKAKKDTDTFGKSLSRSFKNILKYVFGIRSIMVLTNRLRQGLITGMQNLARASSLVNRQMSSIITSMLYMKNASATAAQPLLNILAPALVKISALFEKAAYAVGSFFAALTGQKFVYRAVRVQQDYAASLDKSSKSAKKLRQELSGLDKLNVLHTQDNGGGGGNNPTDYGAMFKKAPVDDEAAKWAKKFKKLMEDFFEPLKKAWKAEGKFVMDSWKKALKNVKSLILTIGKDFMKVWKQDATVEIFEDLFHIVGDIGLIVANLAGNFEKAWKKNKTGLKILKNIRDIIGIIVKGIRRCADYTVLWSKRLNFTNLLESIERLTKGLQRPIKSLVDIVSYFYKSVVLPFIKYLVETGLPLVFDAVNRVINRIEWDKLQLRLERLMNALEPFLEKTWEAFATVLEDIGNAIADFVNSDTFGRFIDLLIDWMNNADPAEMAKKIEHLINAFIIVKGLLGVGGFFATAIINLGTLKAALMNLFGAEAVLGLSGAGLIGAIKKAGSGIVSAISGVGTSMATAWAGAGLATQAALVGVGVIIAAEFAHITDISKEFEKSQEETANAHQKIIDTLTDTYAQSEEAGEQLSQSLYGQKMTLEEAIAEERKIAEKDAGSIWEGYNKGMVEKWNQLRIGEWMLDAISYPVMLITHFLGIASPSKLFYGIGENIIQGLFNGLSKTWNKLKKTVEKIWKSIGTNAKKLIGGVKTLVSTGQNLVKGLCDGIRTRWNETKSSIEKIWSGLVDKAKSTIGTTAGKSGKLFNSGKQLVAGAVSGIKEKWAASSATVSNVWSKIVSGAKTVLRFDTFFNIGKNVIDGLFDGLKRTFEAGKSFLDSMFSSITDKANKTYDINSPSKVFFKIGEYITEGLLLGMEEDSNSANVTKIFENMMPNVNSLTSFSDEFLDKLTRMSQDASYIVDAMIDNINKILASLDNLDALDKFTSSMQELAKLDIPKITQGFVLPSTIEFSQIKNSGTDEKKSEVDLTMLPDMMRDAFLDALTKHTLTNASDSDIIINIDGREVFNVVKSANLKYKKQYGVSAFL